MAKKETFGLTINVDRIPQSAARTFSRKDGSEGMQVNLIMSRRSKPDLRGNNYSIYVPQSKADRNAGVPPIFVGDGKLLNRDFSNDTDGDDNPPY